MDLSERRFMECCEAREGVGNKELSLLDIAPHLPIYQAKERDFQHLPSPEGDGRGREEEEEGAVVFTKGPLRQFVHFPTSLICQNGTTQEKERGDFFEVRMETRPQI